MVIELTKDEAKILERIVGRLGPAELRAYITHRQGRGYEPATLNEIKAAQGLYAKGWLVPEPQLFDCPPLYLSPAAWRRYELAEWSEVEECAAREKVKKTFGEW